MVVKKTTRAAYNLISGRAYDRSLDRHRVIIIPGLLDLATQYGICAIEGKGGLKPLGQYIEEKLIEDIRKKEKERENLPVNQ